MNTLNIVSLEERFELSGAMAEEASIHIGTVEIL